MMRLSWLFAALFVCVVAAPLAPAGAQNAAVPIIVMGDDSNPKSVRRSNDIYRRVIMALKDQLGRGFRIIDEDMIAGELGWRTVERRTVAELAETLKALRGTQNPRIQARVVVVFRVFATATDRGFATIATARVDGEIFDATGSGDSLGNWEAPTQSFPGPANCNTICLEEIVGERAREIGAAVGDVLKKKLANVAGQASPSDGMAGLTTQYAITFRNFTTRDVFRMTEVMEREFPGFVNAQMPAGDGVSMKYGYATRAPQDKLYRWMHTLLADMGFNPDNEVKVQISGTALTVEKLFDTQPPPMRGSGRFN